MDARMLNTIANFIWGIADDCLRDVYVRGKYRDVILPMTVIRRLDAVLEDTKLQVLDNEEEAGYGGDHQPVGRALQCCRAGFLQRFALLPARPDQPPEPRKSSRRTLKHISTAFRLTCRKFWTSSSSETRSTP